MHYIQWSIIPAFTIWGSNHNFCCSDSCNIVHTSLCMRFVVENIFNWNYSIWFPINKFLHFREEKKALFIVLNRRNVNFLNENFYFRNNTALSRRKISCHWFPLKPKKTLKPKTCQMDCRILLLDTHKSHAFKAKQIH